MASTKLFDNFNQIVNFQIKLNFQMKINNYN